jgi:hypothetical protein
MQKTGGFQNRAVAREICASLAQNHTDWDYKLMIAMGEAAIALQEPAKHEYIIFIMNKN